jgi:transposase
MKNNELFESILDIRELEVLSVEKTPSIYNIYVRSQLGGGLCSKCGKACSKVKKTYTRVIKDLPISGKKVALHLEVRQLECDCGNYFTEQFEFVESNKKLTKRYASYIYSLCKGTDLQYVARREELSWRTVQKIFEEKSNSLLSNQNNWANVTRLALDEIALRKGHRNYVVVVLDLDRGIILDILEDRSKDFLIKYFKSKGSEFCNRIEVFCSDMWSAYLNCAKVVFPNADIVADRFHFYGKCQDAINHARKSFRKKYPKADELKKLRWALLKNPENLTDKERKKLKIVFEKEEYKLLELTWNARNIFRDILQTPLSVQEAQKRIEYWIVAIKKYEIHYLYKFVDFYSRWKKNILNYFKGRFSTGKLEGINNKLKLIKRRAFGFLDFNAFRLRALVEFSSSSTIP